MKTIDTNKLIKWGMVCICLWLIVLTVHSFSSTNEKVHVYEKSYDESFKSSQMPKQTPHTAPVVNNITSKSVKRYNKIFVTGNCYKLEDNDPFKKRDVIMQLLDFSEDHFKYRYYYEKSNSWHTSESLPNCFLESQHEIVCPIN